MKYQKTISKLREAMLRIQGQDLKQVLLRAAAKRAEFVAENVFTAEEIFHELKQGIYARTNEMAWDEAFNIVSDAAELEEIKRELIDNPSEKFAWEELKAILLEGLEKKDKAIVEPLLDNQHSHMMCEAAATGSHDIAGFKRILIPLVRRIFGDLPVRDIVGIQPMNGPVDLVYGLRYRQKNPETGEYEDVPPDAFEDVAELQQLEGKKGRQLTLEVVTDAVEAYSRKLQAGWTIEAMQDMKVMHGLDIEAEMIAALAVEVRSEYTAEILSNLKDIAPVTDVKLKGSFKKQISTLGVHINLAANEIARKTRRGAGNFMVVPLTTAVMLEKLDTSIYVPKPDAKKSAVYGLAQVGILNGCIRVYSSLFMETDEILIGYKGGSGETDTGYIYAPYIPLMSTGIVMDAKTYQPVVKLMTRYGKHVADNAKNYYTTLKIDSEFFTIEEDSKSK